MDISSIWPRYNDIGRRVKIKVANNESNNESVIMNEMVVIRTKLKVCIISGNS